MGLIKMITGAVSNNLKDQVVDVFECSNMNNRILGTPATKVLRDGVVNNATDNVITNGSVFNVSINQAAIFVENGKVHDFIIATSEDMTGQYRYDSTVEPSLLGGGFKDVLPTIKKMASNFTAGGQSKNVMRLYYVNCQVITGNPIGMGNITFRDGETGVNVIAQAHGHYEFQIVNPVVFYENYVKNVSSMYSIESDDGVSLIRQMKTEVTPAFTKALGELSRQGIRYEQLASYSLEITDYINNLLRDKWIEKRGIALKDIPLEIEFDQASVKEIRDIQNLKNYQSDAMLRAKMGVSFADAALKASENSNGAMTGFMGVGMANMAMNQQMNQFGFGGNMNQNQQAYDPNAQQATVATLGGNQQAAPQQAVPQAGGAVAPVPAPVQASANDEWTCSCGAVNKGNFCVECGSKKPEPVAVGWTCSCGAVNKGKFCPECGSKKPADAPLYKCDKCGWEPEDPKNPPKFCQNCGDKFDDNDITN